YVYYRDTVTFINAGDSCRSIALDSVLINPAPPLPNIASFSTSGLDNSFTYNLCQGASFINFLDITPSQPGLSYNWSASPSNGVQIFSPDSSNTIISFPQSGTFTVNIQTTTPASEGSCTNTGTNLTMVVDPAFGDTIRESRIIHKNPGNLLVYLDNTMDGYKWGYDSIPLPNTASNLLATGIPNFVTGQVYQAFVTPSRFILNDFPDINSYRFWVMVFEIIGNDTCFTKVYFNGPNAPPRAQPNPVVPDEVIAQVFPNPNNGNFDLVLSGNIYNNISVRVFNTLGETVYDVIIEKGEPVQKYPINLTDLKKGMYYVDVRGNYGEQAVSKILIK
ncbi:MAG: T9SS type A sorting domain-containing protein, partial [Bacteroidota bacterium]